MSDDLTLLLRTGRHLQARSPKRMAGRMEIRGLGIRAFDYVDDVPVALILQLSKTMERMPEPAYREISGIRIRELSLNAMSNSAEIVVELAVRECLGTMSV